MAKKVLGRGLGAFFPDYEEAEKAGLSNKVEISKKERVLQRVNVTIQIPVTDIRPNPHQPREDFDELKLQELADSIRMHGLIQPVTVRAIGYQKYELIAGERRLRASKMAGFQTIPAYVREVDDDDVVALALIENVQREQLNPIEVALGYKRLIEECNYTQEKVAKNLGKNRSTITNMLRLLNLKPSIQSALKTNAITTGHARSLITVEDEKKQEMLLRKAIEEDWSVRQIEDAVRKLQNKRKPINKFLQKNEQKDIHLMEISNRLRNRFSTRVQIKKKKKGGEIRLEYYSDDDLNRIIGLLERVNEK